MPRVSAGARLWLRPAERNSAGKITRPARFVILDRGKQIGTGCGPGDRAEAERKLSTYIAGKYEAPRRERGLHQIRIADVISIYLKDVVPGQARPDKAAERSERLLAFFGERMLDEINGDLCRQYESSRAGKGQSNKGKGGGAKRDLEDLRAAIRYHQKIGLHRENVAITLPKRGKPRQRWLTRSEVATLLWTCWTYREVQDGKPTKKRPLRHLCRFILLAIYTGSRPGAVLAAAWDRGLQRSWVDVERGRFHRLQEGHAETDKRQPTVTIAPRLLAHLRRWKRIDEERGYVVRFNGERVESIKTAMNRAVELSGLGAGVSAYTCRHTAATWLVSKGVSVWRTAEFLGTSPAMIEKHYGHFAPDYQSEAANAIGRK